MKKLYLELSSLEHMGTTIWFEGVPSNSKEVTEELSVTEENSYMRDYIFNEGVLTELHFDKIKNAVIATATELSRQMGYYE